MADAKKIKKWSNTEILKIISYLEENRKFEHPTAKIYYENFLQQSQVSATWQIVKFKVRYLKEKFKKAEAWAAQTGSGLIEDDLRQGTTTVQEKLNKICPFYDALKDIFGHRAEALNDIVYDTGGSDITQLLSYEVVLDDLETHSSTMPQDDAVVVTPTCSPKPCNDSSTEKRSKFKRKFNKPSSSGSSASAMAALAAMQEERSSNIEKKMKFEEDKFKQELAFNREKLQAEIEFKEKELELKKLELEKNERLARYELELKYRTGAD